MKVLFLTFSYPTPEDPVRGIFVKEHARAAAAHCEVAVVHLDRGGGPYGIEEVEGEEFPTLRVRYPRSRLAYLRHFQGAVAAFRRLHRQGFDPEVIHAHFFLAALPPLLLSPLFRRPVVVTEHWSVFLPEDPARLSPAMLRVVRYALRRAACVMPASEALRRGMEALGVEARYRVVPNVVDESLFHPDGHAPGIPRRLIFVGLLYEAKGIEHLLRAVALLARCRDDFVVEIAGDGPLRAEYEQLAARLGISGVVAFLGLQPKTEIGRLLRRADLFVLTSRYDNNPCALIEAQASGLPAVATRVGGIPEILADGTGLLAEAGDPESIASRINEALDGIGQFDRAAIARRARERYGAERVGGALYEIYASAVGGR